MRLDEVKYEREAVQRMLSDALRSGDAAAASYAHRLMNSLDGVHDRPVPRLTPTKLSLRKDRYD